YLAETLSVVSKRKDENCLIFLDPDTGSEPGKPSFDHVINSEIETIWQALRGGYILACYQHKTTRRDQEWIEPKREQLAVALNVSIDAIKVAKAFGIARDVVLPFCLNGYAI
ncbi:MAG: hypothetical protein OTJ97_08875, partial [SAR202 cluster bacterium]|nr:hypothetical protein [SAR202 cluster bacterium]